MEMLKNLENELEVIDSAVEACMDEDVKVGLKTVKFGIAGSGVVDEEGGSKDGKLLYPVEDRILMRKGFPHIRNGLTELTSKLGIPLFSCSHPGCGAGNAQGFSKERMIKSTKKLARGEVRYLGHIKISATPENLDDTDASASITREESNHTHTTKRARLTIGGGITGAEQEKEGNFFDISSDWVGFDQDPNYSEDEKLKEEEKVGVLYAQMKLGWMIAPGIRDNQIDPFIIYDAHRIKDKEALNENRRIAELAIAKAKEEMEKGKWITASHT
jgi:hypothetical protein